MWDTFLLRDMLLVEVRLDRHEAPRALLEIRFLRALIQLVLVVAGHFDDLRAGLAVCQHLALQHVVQVHLVGIEELRRADAAELARSVPFFITGFRSKTV